MADEWEFRKTDTENVFEISRLSVRYGEKKVIDQITMAISRRHITAVIGPSGSGKTTFLRALNRMDEMNRLCVREGTICYDNMDISRIADVNRLRRAIGMIFQTPNPFPMSVYENLAFPLRCAGEKDRQHLDERVETALRQADVWDEVKDRLMEDARQLSAGQQQRLCIARALSLSPDVLLMDEPTSSLDPTAVMKIEDLIQGLSARYSILLVTHNLQQAARCSDETAFLLDGRLVEYGNTARFFSMPEKKETEEYITGRFG